MSIGLALAICAVLFGVAAVWIRELLKGATKEKADTGGGCSICGAKPCVNVTGTYWLCGPCVLEYHGEPK